MKNKKNNQKSNELYIVVSIILILVMVCYIIPKQYGTIKDIRALTKQIEEEQASQEAMWDYIIEHEEEFYETYDSGCNSDGTACWEMRRLKGVED